MTGLHPDYVRDFVEPKARELAELVEYSNFDGLRDELKQIVDHDGDVAVIVRAFELVRVQAGNP